IIISKTKDSVEEKYNTIKELLENDKRATLSLIEAESLAMEVSITGEEVVKGAYSDAITSMMERVNEMNMNQEPQSIQTLQ
ncbi:hypothetical protein scyTo_0025466, partial [Scyliorhinus torazame]|nr:hypothetical protein [Scyliorhinus torazame]